MAGQGTAWRGVAGFGSARHGAAWQGAARRGPARLGTARQGMAWQGWARPGRARPGKAGRGEAWRGMAGRGEAWRGEALARQGMAWDSLKREAELLVAPFTPKGEVPEWQKVYAYIEELQVGDSVTYEELDDCLERDFRVNRNPLYPAIRQLEREHRRTLVPVVGKGYRVAQASEHEQIAKGKHQRARRQMRRGVEVLEAADRTQLTNEQIGRLERLEELYRRQEEKLKKQQRQLDRLERKGKATIEAIEGMTSADPGEQKAIEKIVERLIEKNAL